MFATKSLHWSFQFKSIAIQFSMVSNIEVQQLQFTTKHIRHLLQRYITLFVVTTDAKLTLGDLPGVPFPDDLFLAFFNCFSCMFTLPHHWLQLPSNTRPSSGCKFENENLDRTAWRTGVRDRTQKIDYSWNLIQLEVLKSNGPGEEFWQPDVNSSKLRHKISFLTFIKYSNMRHKLWWCIIIIMMITNYT